MKEKIKQFVNLIKKLNSTPRGKSVLFFGFYGIFFIFLFIAMAVGRGSGYSLDNLGNSSNFSLESIYNNNFEFSYKVSIDESIYMYTGKRYNDKESFIFNNLEYYNLDDDFYQRTGDSFIETVNPYVYSDFMKVDNIQEFINLATLNSKTEYENGDFVYNYKISTTSIVKKIEDIDIDIDDLPNEISVCISNGNIKSIEFNLNSYGLFKGISNDKFVITLSYFNQGEVSDFDILTD